MANPSIGMSSPMGKQYKNVTKVRSLLESTNKRALNINDKDLDKLFNMNVYNNKGGAQNLDRVS